MRTAARVFAGLNAAFQMLFGFICVLAPPIAAQLFKVDVTSVPMFALIRIFGGLLASSGILSAMIAKNPDRDGGLVSAFGAVLLLNVATDGLVLAAGEMRVDQLIAGMIIESITGVLLLIYRFGQKR